MILVTGGLFIVLAALSAIDFREHRLPDWLTLPLIAGGLAFTAVGEFADLPANAGAAGAGFFAFWSLGHFYRLTRGRNGLGLGDAKLLAAVGAWLGPLYLAPVVLLSALLALAFALALHVVGRRISFASALPFGPFLSCAFICLWFAKLANWSLF